MKTLLIGGSGKLGTELQKYIKCDAPSSKKLDITKQFTWSKDYELIINASGYTDVAGAEKDPDRCYDINFFGVSNLANYFNGIPMVHISTEYIYNPQNVYSWSKVASEGALKHPYLCIRTLFKPRPYNHDRAWVDQWTTGDYVDVIVPMILTKIANWDKKSSIVTNVGTGRKTIYDLAKMSKPDVKKAYLSKTDLPVKLPLDYL